MLAYRPTVYPEQPLYQFKKNLETEGKLAAPPRLTTDQVNAELIVS